MLDMIDITSTERRLWLASILAASFLPIAGTIAMLTYGPDAVMIVFTVFSSMALLGIWRRSSAGNAFLLILLVLEGFYLITVGLSSFGLSALSGQGFRAFDRIVAILLAVIALTVLPLGLFTTFLNRLRHRAAHTLSR